MHDSPVLVRWCRLCCNELSMSSFTFRIEMPQATRNKKEDGNYRHMSKLAEYLEVNLFSKDIWKECCM